MDLDQLETVGRGIKDALGESILGYGIVRGELTVTAKAADMLRAKAGSASSEKPIIETIRSRPCGPDASTARSAKTTIQWNDSSGERRNRIRASAPQTRHWLLGSWPAMETIC